MAEVKTSCVGCPTLLTIERANAYFVQLHIVQIKPGLKRPIEMYVHLGNDELDALAQALVDARYEAFPPEVSKNAT